MKTNHSLVAQCAPVLLTAVMAMTAVSAALATDWPGWRGPDRTGISKETGLLKEWPTNGPKLVWQIKDAGSGYSTPSVVGDRLYLIANEGIENEFVEALSSKDGSKLWSTPLGKVGNPKQTPNFPGARSTAVIDSGSLYAMSSDGDLVCLDPQDGKARWKKSLRNDFGGDPGRWAYAESPLIDGDKLICAPGGSNATVIALNKKTGDVIWKTAIPGGEQAGYASAIVSEAGGVRQYLEFLAKGVVSVDAKTGQLLWRYDRTAQGSSANIPTPIASGDMVYSAAGRSGGGLVKIKKTDDKWDVEQVYFSPKLPTAIGGVVKLGDYLYGTSQALQCIEFATGNVKWEDKSVGAGSLCAAEGLLYIHGENNQVALVEATPEACREKGRLTPPEPPTHAQGMEKAWAYPVIANGKLYVRDLGTLWCYDIKQ